MQNPFLAFFMHAMYQTICKRINSIMIMHLFVILFHYIDYTLKFKKIMSIEKSMNSYLVNICLFICMVWL